MRVVDIPSRDQALHLKNMEMVKRHDFGEDVTTLPFQVTQFQQPLSTKAGSH